MKKQKEHRLYLALDGGCSLIVSLRYMESGRILGEVIKVDSCAGQVYLAQALNVSRHKVLSELETDCHNNPLAMACLQVLHLAEPPVDPKSHGKDR